VKYRIEISRRAQRYLSGLARELQGRMQAAIDGLANEPRPLGVQKLHGEEDGYRIRVGDYRILYEIRDDVLLILVIKIGHRREVYR
jgi:mRNA interferase RelE/StbE